MKLPGAIRSSDATVQEASILEVGTLVLWLGCSAVGTGGFLWRYPRPFLPARAPAPTTAEILRVELTKDPVPPPAIAPANPEALPSPLPVAPASPPAATLVAVAEPGPSIAFPVPIEGPTQIVDLKQASYGKPTTATPALASASASASAATAGGPALQSLAFGQGEGRQPAPQYPARAKNAGQEGTVVVRFSVGEDGRVLTAESASPSPWPLLNEAALRVVRERWRFRPGPARLFEVAIRFELGK